MLLSVYMSVRAVSIKWSSSSLMRPDHCTISRCYKWELDWLHIFIPRHLNKVSKWDFCQKSIIELAYHITFMPGTYIAFTNGFHLILGLLQFDWGWLSIKSPATKIYMTTTCSNYLDMKAYVTLSAIKLISLTVLWNFICHFWGLLKSIKCFLEFVHVTPRIPAIETHAMIIYPQ